MRHEDLELPTALVQSYNIVHRVLIPAQVAGQ